MKGRPENHRAAPPEALWHALSYAFSLADVSLGSSFLALRATRSKAALEALIYILRYTT
jgi:hypothetical protein